MRRRPKFVVAATAVGLLATAGRTQRDAFTESVTDRGMRIWSFPDDGGDRFVLAALVGVGSRDEAAGQHGIAHYLEHVVLARTALRPKAAADSDLLALGVKWNGFTTHESTVYYLECDASDWHFAVEWLADHLLHPAFDLQDVDAERRIVRAEIETRQAHAGEVTFEGLLYPGQALGRSVGGESAGLDLIDRAALQHFHAVHYRAANVAVGFAGRVPRDQCTEAIRSAFAGLASGKGAEVVDPVRPRTGDLTPNGTSAESTASMTTGFHLPAASPRDLAMAQLLSGYLNERFFAEVREARQLAYAPEVNAVLHRDTCRLDFRVHVPDRRDLEAVLDIVDALVAELRQVDVVRLATARSSLGGLLDASDHVRLAAAMERAWLVRRHSISPSELALAITTISEREVADFARENLTKAHRFLVADVPIARPFTLWAAVAVLAVLLLLLDSFQSFASSRSIAAGLVDRLRRLRTLGRRRRRSRRGAVVPFEARPPATTRPIVPVPGDEIEKSIQRYFDEEEKAP